MHAAARMTIDSNWLKVVKQGCPSAFTPQSPLPAGVVFIDGQIRLMKPDYIRTWDLFVRKQFIEVIDRWFAQGAVAVALGFDDYEHVPASKHMTQRKRSQHVPALNFEAHMDLPPTIPDNWSAAMRNRAFKVKVVSLVTAYVRKQYANCGDRTVLIDHSRDVETLGRPWPLPAVLTADGGRAPQGRGECDIKAFAYMHAADGGPASFPLTLASTDGDFLPIALLQIEQALEAGTKPPDVVLHRMRTSMPSDADHVKQQRYEYLHVQPVYAWLRAQCPGVARPAQHFAALAAGTGCDFSQNLPQLGPARLWKIRDRFKKLDVASDTGLMAVLFHAYLYLYQNKVSISVSAARNVHSAEDLSVKYDELMQAVRRNVRVADSTKRALWGADRALAHARNCVWTLQYWSRLHECPCPLSADFGFRRVGAAVEFSGAQPADPAPAAPAPARGKKRKK